MTRTCRTVHPRYLLVPLLFAFVLAVLAGCRVDGQIRASDDIARRLPAGAREGSIELTEMDGDDNEIPSDWYRNNEDGTHATFRVYLTPPRDVEEAIAAKIAEGNADDDKLRPDDGPFQRARVVDFDIPGGGDALDFVAFDAGLEIRHTGTVGEFLSPKLLVFVAEEDVENIYKAADDSNNSDDQDDPDEPKSVQVASVELERSIKPGSPVSLSLREMVERGDDAFGIIEQGRFQIGVVFGAGVIAENNGSNISWPEEVSWRISDITLIVGATPYEAFR